MKRRQITNEEWESYDWVEVTTPSDEERVFLKGVKKTMIPPCPDNVYKYELKEVTKVTDNEQKWEWVRVMTEE